MFKIVQSFNPIKNVFGTMCLWKIDKLGESYVRAHSLTRKWNNCVDLNWVHGLTIGGNDCHTMAFDSHLCRTHRCECIDQTETISATRRDCEYFQRRVRHKTGVWIAELTATIDQHRFGILSSVDSQTAGETFGGVFMQPIADQNDVRCQIEIV